MFTIKATPSNNNRSSVFYGSFCAYVCTKLSTQPKTDNNRTRHTLALIPSFWELYLILVYA